MLAVPPRPVHPADNPKTNLGADMHTRPRIGTASQRTDAGFTLLELLVVLAIMALTVALAAASIRLSRGGPRLQPLAVILAADIRSARTEAITSNRPVGVNFDVKSHAYRIGAGRAVALPRTIAFKLATSEEFRRPTDVGHLVFFPDGSSTGGQLTLSDPNLSITLMIDWLTGSVTARRLVK